MFFFPHSRAYHACVVILPGFFFRLLIYYLFTSHLWLPQSPHIGDTHLHSLAITLCPNDADGRPLLFYGCCYCHVILSLLTTQGKYMIISFSYPTNTRKNFLL